MTTDQVLTNLLDETIAALAMMDAEKLEALSERVELLSQNNIVCNQDKATKALTKKRMLEILLESSESNLRLLERLYVRGQLSNGNTDIIDRHVAISAPG